MRSAIANGLAEEYPTLRSWRSIILIALMLALLFAKQVMDVIIHDLAGHPGANTATPLFAAIVISSIVLLIAQWIVANRPVLSRRRSEQQFRASLNTIGKKEEYDAFIEDLAQEMTRMPNPRFIIIDNYQALDDVTQDVTERYFAQHHSDASQSEFWIVFEGESGDRLSDLALRASKNNTFLHPLIYQQQYLGEGQRRTLAEKVGDPPRAAFLAVKSICRRGEADDEWIAKLLDPLRSRHELALMLPYFHLLAMEVPDLRADHRDAALTSNCYFSWDWLGDPDKRNSGVLALDGVTTEETSLRAAVLGAFFGKALTKAHVSSVARDIQQKLQPLLLETESDQPFFAVIREAALYLYDHGVDQYQLPNPAIAKLFWAFTLSQKKNISKAFWARRIIHHLVEIKLPELPEALVRGKVMEELRNLTLKMVDAALKCGLFAELPELMHFAHLMIEGYDSSKEASLKRLRRTAWQAYHLTGTEEILRVVIATYGIGDEELPPAPPLSTAARVFSQSLPLIPQLRSVLEVFLLADQARRDPEAYDYALARGCWMTLLAVPFIADSSHNPKAFGVFDPSEVRPTVQGIVKRAAERLSSGRDEVSPLDVATLSLAVWCSALMLDPRFLACSPAPLDGSPVQWTGSDVVARQIAYELGLVQDVDHLMKAAIRAVTVASGFLTEAKRGGASDFLSVAMVNETCSIALAAVSLGRTLLPLSGMVTADNDDDVRQLLETTDETLGTSLASGGDLFGKGTIRGMIEDLLRVAAMVWQRFGLNRMSEFTSIRYVYYTFAVNQIHADDEERQRPLLAAIEPLIREQHFSGIAANLTLAMCLRESRELASIHQTQAAMLANETLFGEELKETLLVIAGLNGRAKTKAQESIVEMLFKRGEDGVSPADRFLANVEEERLIGATLHLFPQNSGLEAIRMATESLRRRLETVANPDVRQEFEGMLDLYAAEEAIGKHKVDPPQLLSQWAGRKHLWTYPGLLTGLRIHGLADENVKQEGLDLLDRDPDKDSINTWYHLALDLAEDFPEKTENPAIAYVRSVVRRFEDIERAETNMAAYHLLRRREPGNSAWSHGIVRWQRVKILRDYKQKLPLLIQQGKFFLLFTDNVDHMRIWGLRVDMPHDDFLQLRRLPPPGREEWLNDWCARGRRVPEPINDQTRDIAVSAEFLILGTYLFDGTHEEDQRFAFERATLNEKSSRAMPRLLQEIGKFSRIPEEIRRLLHEIANSYADPQMHAPQPARA